MPLLVTAVSALIAAPAHAELGDQLFKLLPGDGAAFDNFAFSVAVSGPPGAPVAIAGAHGNDDNGESSGAAYLFDATTGLEIAKLVPSDGDVNDWFGYAVAISGPTAIVGAYQDDDNGQSSGSAYLFDTTNGQQLFKLRPADGDVDDWFGLAVAISGSTAIVGAYGDDDQGADSGSAYLFDTTTGQQLDKLHAINGARGDRFGLSVAISGPPGDQVAIVGAPQDDDQGADSGSAFLFDVTTGQQIVKLLPDDGAALDFFGTAVAVNISPGDPVAIVGAWADDDNGLQSGSAYLFDITTGAQIAKLLPDDGEANDYFGRSLAISGNIAIVGARRDDDTGTDAGAAYLFDTTTGAQITKLLPDDGAAFDNFGLSVAISGPPGSEIAIAGAHRDDDRGTDAGSAYLFDAGGAPSCPGDLDGDGVVGFADLIAVLAAWGNDGGPEDLDGSGVVDFGDIIVVLSAWGPCG